MNTFKYCLGLFLLFYTSAFSQTGSRSVDSLMNQIEENGINKENLERFDFLLRNGQIRIEEGGKILSSLPETWEKDYLSAVIKTKQTELNQAYDLLRDAVSSSPQYYPFYELLAKIASATNRKTGFDSNATSGDLLFAKGAEAYYNGDYSKAAGLLNSAAEANDNSFEINYLSAYVQRNLGNYEKAEEFLEKAHDIAEGSPKRIKALIASGSLNFLSGNYSKAKSIYDSSLKQASENGFTIEKIKALLNLALIEDREGKISTARGKFERALKLTRDIIEPELEATVLSEYAVSFTYTEEIIRARKLYEQAADVFSALNNKNRFALTKINIGNLLLNQSNFREAEKQFRIALNKASENARTKMLALMGLGDVHQNLSNFSKAIGFYRKADKIAADIKELTSRAKIKIGMGTLFYNLKNFDESLKNLRQASELIDPDYDPYTYADALQKTGIVQYSHDSLRQATEYFSRAVKIQNRFGDVFNALQTNIFLGFTESKQGRYREALNIAFETSARSEDYGLLRFQGLSELLKAEIYDKEGNYSDERAALLQSQNFATKSEDVITSIQSNYRLARLAESNGQIKEADDYFNAAINLIDKHSRSLFNNAGIQMSYFAGFERIYSTAAEFYLNQNKFKTAFTILDMSRSRNLTQNLFQLKINNSSEDLIQRFYDVEWAASKSTGNIADSLSNLAENQRIELLNRNPELAPYLSLSSKTAHEELKKKLQDGEVYISYFFNSAGLNAFVIDKNGLIYKELSSSQEEIESIIGYISAYYDYSLAGKEIFVNKDLFAFNVDAAHKLYRKLIVPLHLPESTHSLIFTLPAELVSLPLEFLVINEPDGSFDYAGAEYLLSQYAVSYTPAASIWMRLKDRQPSAEATALLIGDPVFDNNGEAVSTERGAVEELRIGSRSFAVGRLEYSGEEVNSIAAIINGAEVYLSDEATETVFDRYSPSASIIHLSTHSLLLGNKPVVLFSSSDSENDGLLEPGEIAESRLNSDLVVLSSCKSGLGKIDRAEGIIGMQKAFMEAGAASVVSTLWDINDKNTSKLMDYFYTYLGEGLSKSEALRKAKLKFIKEDSPNPYYWAAFVLSGSTIPLNVKLNTMNFFTLFFIILSLLLLISAAHYKMKNRQRPAHSFL